MTRSKVEAYSLGFNTVEKQASFHYWLKGENSPREMVVTPAELFALADMCRNEGSVIYDSSRESFLTERALVGHGENVPHPKYP